MSSSAPPHERDAAPETSVVIVTKDRRDDVLAAVASAVAQEPPVEVLVVDDGSSDGTAEAIRSAFPRVRLERREQAEGYIKRRNEAATIASGAVIVSIDDDAEFTTPEIVAQTVRDFDDALIGAVAIPYVDLPQDETLRQRAPDDEAVYVTNVFRGTAYAISRAMFLELRGYRTSFFHQAEEQDLCLRMLAAGYVVRLGRADAIRHHGSKVRDIERMWFYGCRNDVLFLWHNVPLPALVPRLAKTTAYALWLGVRVRRPTLFIRGILAGYREAITNRTLRSPVPRGVWRLYAGLASRARPLDEVRSLLPRPRRRAPARSRVL